MGTKGYDFWVEMRLKDTGLSKGLGVARDTAKGAMSAMTGLEKATHNLRSVWSQFGGMLSVGAVTAGLAKGAKDFAQFETAMAKVGVMTGVGAKRLDAYGSAISDLSLKTGIADEVLAGALTDAASVTGDIEAGMRFIGVASKVAVGGFTDVGDAAESLRSVLKSYGMSLDEANRVGNIFAVVQRDAKVTMGEFGHGMAAIAPTAGLFGISMEQVAAALSASKQSGVSFETSVGAVQNALSGMAAPGRRIAPILAKYGLTMDKSKLQSMGFVGALSYLRKGLKDNAGLLKIVLGGQEGLNLAMNLTSEQGAKRFADTLDRATESMTDLDKANDRMAGTVANRMARLKEGWDDILQTAGGGILDVFGLRGNNVEAKIAGFLSDANDAVKNFFQDFPYYIEQAEKLGKVFLGYQALKGIGGALSVLKSAAGGGVAGATAVPGSGGGRSMGGTAMKGLTYVFLAGAAWEVGQVIGNAVGAAIDRVGGGATAANAEANRMYLRKVALTGTPQERAAAEAVAGERARLIAAAPYARQNEDFVNEQMIDFDANIENNLRKLLSIITDQWSRSLAQSEEAGMRETKGFQNAAEFLDVFSRQGAHEAPPVQVSVSVDQTVGLEKPLTSKTGSVRAKIDRGEGEARLVSPRYRMTLVREGAAGLMVHPLEDRIIDATMLDGGA